MKAHLDAIAERLGDVGVPAHIVWATGPHPYYVLTSPAWDASDEANVATAHDTLDATVRVKAVTGTAAGVLRLLELARDELSPELGTSDLDVAGWSSTIRFTRSEFVDVDRDVKITGTDRHPFVGVDTYRVVSQPVPVLEESS